MKHRITEQKVERKSSPFSFCLSNLTRIFHSYTGKSLLLSVLLFCSHNENKPKIKIESENKNMTYCYTTSNKPLRQSIKQRQSSLISEHKFLKRNPIAEKVVIKFNSEFSQNVVMSRNLMKSANFNTLNTIPDYANSMSEVITKKAA